MLKFANIDDTLILLTTESTILIENRTVLQVSELPGLYKSLAFQDVTCVIGVIKLKLNSYLVIVDAYERAGEVLGHAIGKITGYQIIPLFGSKTKSDINNEEQEYLKLFRKQLDKNQFFFAINNDFDLTTNIQLKYTKNIGINNEFWWNKYLTDNCTELGIPATFVTPIINGYFKSQNVTFDGRFHLNYILITRKSIRRSGTRYFRRGIDDNGDVANFNETEQIVISNNQIKSFLQIRGSVPLYWSEVNNLKYKPNLIVSSKNSVDSTTKHFSRLVADYGDVYCINLVNNKGYELPIKQGYELIINSLADALKKSITYVYFDFHHECKNMQFQNVEKLIHTLEGLGFLLSNYFQFDLTLNSVKHLQSKVIRTNCMDCLDRTNVVQSIFSRWVLQQQLESLGYVNPGNPWKIVDAKFNYIFQNIWADNADAVSNSYSSTPALKTDFTRLGKRTILGALNDLSNSIMRYYNNNLTDGSRQDSFDLFLGNFKPFESPANPFVDYRPNYVQILPYMLFTSVLIFLSMIFYPKGSLFSLKNLLAITCCLFFQFRAVSYIMQNPYQYVNWPSLVSLDFLNKLKVNDKDGNIIGVKYEHTRDFKVQTKKSN